MTKVQFYSGSTVPTTTNLPEGGIYFNTDNKNIYVRKNDNTIHNFNIGDKVESSGSVDSATKANCLVCQNQLTSIEAIDNFLVGGEIKYTTFKTNEIESLNFGSNDGMLLSIPWYDNNTYGVQLAFDDNPAGNIAFRGKSTNWGSWHKFIHSGNIGSQSVNYANSAGNADSATILKPTDNTSTVSAAVSSWAANSSSGKIVWRESFKESSYGTDTGDMVLWVNKNTAANGTELNMTIDGNFYAEQDKQVIHTGNIGSQLVNYATKDDLTNAINNAITTALKASY